MQTGVPEDIVHLWQYIVRQSILLLAVTQGRPEALRPWSGSEAM